MNNYQRTRLLLWILLLELTLVVFVWVKNTKPVALESPLFKQIPKSQPVVAFNILKKMSFEGAESLKAWEEKIFKGKTLYEIAAEGGANFLKASSQGGSSGLYMKMDMRVTPQLFLSWKWKAVEFPQKKQPELLSNRREDDFAARVYVIFPGSTFFNTNVIEYIWDKDLPEGTLASSPFSERIKLFVIRSGPQDPTAPGAGWQLEERNIYEDYKQFFGKPPERPIGAIAIMSDSDNTGTSSGSFFGDLLLKEKKTDQPAKEIKP